MLVNEYKLYVFNSKMVERCKVWAMFISGGPPFVISRTDAQNGVEIIFKISSQFKKSEAEFHETPS
jgi:hypothetical protein